jgi:hypothetical protein
LPGVYQGVYNPSWNGPNLSTSDIIATTLKGDEKGEVQIFLMRKETVVRLYT